MASTWSLSLLLLSGVVTAAQNYPLADFVRTDTGSTNNGNTFPGVTRPLGMVKLGPDHLDPKKNDAYSGYRESGPVLGFSMLHESGTGGAPKYGVVAQMPVVGAIENPLVMQEVNRTDTDVTRVGYYKSSLTNGVQVELAGTHRAGLYRYQFPEGQQPGIIVDVSHVLKSFRGQGLGQHYLGGALEVDNSGETAKYQGYGDYDNGWNRSPAWRAYFCGYFDQPAAHQSFTGKDLELDELAEKSDAKKLTSSSARLGALFTFDERNITSRVGVSFISTEQACRNVDTEIPKGTELEDITEDSKREWEETVLSKVTTKEKDPEKLAQLYTALYFMNLLPTNKTGENPGWESDEPYYDDIFTFWDTFRCTTSLFHILQPKAYEEFIRSWVDIWRHEGFMSDARSSNWNGAIQGGTNVDNVFADAYVKGVRGKIDWQDAYEAMRTDAEETPPNDDDGRDDAGSVSQGRGALPDWLELGYITPKFMRSASRAVEYSVNDFALHQVAKGLEKEEDAAKYLWRSQNWRNHWNPEVEALGHSGFVMPRDLHGFIYSDPMGCAKCYWHDYYYQGRPWEYSFNSHHDMATIVDYVGGEDRFLDRLNLTFEPDASGEGTGTLFDPSNEPSFGTPYLYNFINRQDLSVQRSRSVAKTHYSATPGGLPGNSDAGAMESWLLWNMIGMYPLTGQTTFLIGSPWFEDLTIHLGDGKKLEIFSKGGDEESFYVQKLKVNGEDWDRNWVTWDDIFAEGGTLEFELGPKPKRWDTGDPPPSPGSVKAKEPPHQHRGIIFQGGTAVAAIAGGSGVVTTLAVLIMMYVRRRDAKDKKKKNIEAATPSRSSSQRPLLSPTLGRIFGWRYTDDEPYRNLTERGTPPGSGSSTRSNSSSRGAGWGVEVRPAAQV